MSETAPEALVDPAAAAQTPAEAGQPATGEPEPKDWQAEAEKWKKFSRDNEARAKVNADAAKRLAEIEDQGKSDLEKLTGRLTAAETRAQAAESRLLRSEVATEKGLPAKLAARLQGSTREELEADADELLASLPATQAPSPGSADQGSRRATPQTAQQRVEAARKADGWKGGVNAKLAALSTNN